MNVKDAEAYIRLQRSRKRAEERGAAGSMSGDVSVADRERSWTASPDFTQVVEQAPAIVAS